MKSIIIIGLALSATFSALAKEPVKSAETVIVNHQKALNVVYKSAVFTTTSGDQLQLQFELYVDPGTGKLVEAYFVGGSGTTANGGTIYINTQPQEGMISDSGNCADFSLLIKYSTPNGNKSAFYETTKCL